MHIDVHQHLWTEPLLDSLATRQTLPFVRRSHGLTVLHSAGEQPYLIDLEAEACGRRASLLDADGLDLALVALSSAIGVEALPRAEACELIEAHLRGRAHAARRTSRHGVRSRSTGSIPTTSTGCSRAAASASRCPPRRSPDPTRWRGRTAPGARASASRGAVRAPRPGARACGRPRRRSASRCGGGR